MSSVKTNEPTALDLAKAIQESINARLTEVADEEFEKAKKCIEARKAEIVTGVVLRVEKHLSFERLGESIRIDINNHATEK